MPCHTLRRSLLPILALLSCLLFGASATYYTAQNHIRNIQQRRPVGTLGVADNQLGCWDDRFAYQYWSGRDNWIEAEFVSATQLDARGLEIINNPARSKHRLDASRWVWEDVRNRYPWTPETLHKLTVVEATVGEHRFWGRFAVGWPRRAFTSTWRQSLPVSAGLVSIDVPLDGALVQDGQLVDDAWIRPTRILWPGAIFNTCVFAGMWAGAITAVGLTAVAGRGARRSLRTKRGRCPSCGYELLHSLNDGCPECGWER